MKNFRKLLITGMVVTGLAAFAQNTSDSAHVPVKRAVQQERLPAIDLYGAIPHFGSGFGLGFGMFSKPLLVEQFSPNQRLELRLGGDFYFLQYGHRSLGNVPLVAPQTGDAKLKMSQYNYGVNGVARFILVSGPAKFVPYADLFAGLRGFSADIEIIPLKYQQGYEESTSKNLSSTSHFNYGFTVGFMYAINKSIMFNTGLMYSTSGQMGQIDDVKRARIESGALVTEKVQTPKDAVVLKVGFTFLIRKSENRTYEEKDDCNCRCGSKRSRVGTGVFIPSNGRGGLKSNNINIGGPKVSR